MKTASVPIGGRAIVELKKSVVVAIDRATHITKARLERSAVTKMSDRSRRARSAI
jgi:hypothetical protein